MVRSVAASVPVRPLDPGGIATKIERCEPKPLSAGSYRLPNARDFQRAPFGATATGCPESGPIQPSAERPAGKLGQPPSDVAAAEPNRGRPASGLSSYRSQLPGWGRSPAMVCSVNIAPTVDTHRRVRCRDQSSSRSSGAPGAGRFPGTSGTGPHCGLAAEIRRLGSSEPHRSAPLDPG
jgi:hypothetical protein